MSAIKRPTPQCRKYISAKGLYTIADQFNISSASAPSHLSPLWWHLLFPFTSFHTHIPNICNVLIGETASIPWAHIVRWAPRESLHISVHLILQQPSRGDAIINSTLKQERSFSERNSNLFTITQNRRETELSQELPQGSSRHPSLPPVPVLNT